MTVTEHTVAAVLKNDAGAVIWQTFLDGAADTRAPDRKLSWSGDKHTDLT